MPKSKNNKSRFIPYARGFQPPSAKQKQDAIGIKTNVAEFDTNHNFFPAIPKCTSIDDWLAQYDEEGQTYADFRLQCPWLLKRKAKYMKQKFVSDGKNLLEKYPDGEIYVLPLGDFDEANSPHFDALIDYAQVFLGIPIKKLPQVSLEFEDKNIYWIEEKDDGNGNKIVKREKMKSRFDSQSGKRQMCIDEVLMKLRSYKPQNALCLIALTMCDLYEAKTDLFVAGMAAGNQRVAVFSLLRYDPNLTFSTEFWFDIKKKQNYKQDERKRLILQRSCRLLVHELCHLLGIDHCIYFACCMNGSGHLEEDFTQPMYLCPVDLRKLQTLCGFNILQRYKNLHKFFTEHSFLEEAEWTKRRIDFLENETS